MNYSNPINITLIPNQSDPDTTESTITVYEYLGFGCSIAMIIVSIIGAIGNGFAIWHFGRPSSRSSVNVLLTALSTFDFLLLITGTPIYSLLGIYSYNRKHVTLLVLGYCMTVLYPFSNMAQMGSVWTMVLISFERWLGVCHPFLARTQLTIRRARISVLLVTIISILYNLCRFWEYGVEDGLPAPILRTDTVYVLIYVHWMYFAFVFSIPFFVIFIFNILVMLGVRRAMKNRPRCQLNDQQRGERRTTLMLLVVVGVFFACNSLAWILNCYEMLGYQATIASFEFVSDLNNLLILAHPAFNIVVYLRFSSKFRNDFLRCLCRYNSVSNLNSRQNGNDLSVRNSRNYRVLDAAVVPFNHRDRSIKSKKSVSYANQDTSTSWCTVTATNPESQGENQNQGIGTVIVEDKEKLLIKVLGLEKKDDDKDYLFEFEGTAL